MKHSRLDLHLRMMFTREHHQKSPQTFSLSTKPNITEKYESTVGLVWKEETSIKATSCSQHCEILNVHGYC